MDELSKRYFPTIMKKIREEEKLTKLIKQVIKENKNETIKLNK
tara:strand:+ start:103 stop:231 length:129 start_codon:yes stop_codon:yes gene_type:complete